MTAKPTDKSTVGPTAAPVTGLPVDCAQTLSDLAQSDRQRALRDATPQGRHIIVQGQRLLNLASNDYLALSQHPKLIDAAIDATREFGVGAGASRLVSGTQPMHTELEERFAKLKHADAALLLPTGYAANLAVLTTLAGPGDFVVMDKLVHASLIDAAKASGAELRTFPHLNLDRAEHLLTKHPAGRRFIVTDSVFSMDGDCADLPALCDLADRTGASLVIDEAHGTGVLGDDGGGLASAQGVADRVYTCGAGGLVVSTASKALGSLGGIITAAKPVIDLLINQARPFIYSTAVPPAQVAAISAALDVIHHEPDRRARLADMSSALRDRLRQQGWAVGPFEKVGQASSLPFNRGNTMTGWKPVPPTQGWPLAATAPATPIIPLIVGSEQHALHLANHLRQQGILAPAIRPPTVAPGQCRVRLSLRCDLTPSDIDQLAEAIGAPPQ